MGAFYIWFVQLELLPPQGTHLLCNCLFILWYKIFNTQMLIMDHRQPTLNIWKTGMYGLDVICYGDWYHKSDNLDNKYRYRDQTLLYEDLGWIYPQKYLCFPIIQLSLSSNKDVLDWDNRFSEESISDKFTHTCSIFKPLLN